MKTTLIIVAVLLCSLVMSNCTGFKAKQEDTAEDLFGKGMTEFDKGYYHEAIMTFRKLRDWYPYSRHAVSAELKMADSYFNLGRYDQAIYAYRAFDSLHPKNEFADYVINQIGLSYFERLDAADRDQTAAKRALAEFKRLIKRHPDSEHAPKAREYIIECQDSLAGHELVVARYYFKRQNYQAAINRLEAILTDYPEAGAVHEEALQLIKVSEEELGRKTHTLTTEPQK